MPALSELPDPSLDSIAHASGCGTVRHSPRTSNQNTDDPQVDRRKKGRRAHAVLAEARWRTTQNDTARDNDSDNESEENQSRRGGCPAAPAAAAVRHGAVGA